MMPRKDPPFGFPMETPAPRCKRCGNAIDWDSVIEPDADRLEFCPVCTGLELIEMGLYTHEQVQHIIRTRYDLTVAERSEVWSQITAEYPEPPSPIPAKPNPVAVASELIASDPNINHAFAGLFGGMK